MADWDKEIEDLAKAPARLLPQAAASQQVPQQVVPPVDLSKTQSASSASASAAPQGSQGSDKDPVFEKDPWQQERSNEKSSTLPETAPATTEKAQSGKWDPQFVMDQMVAMQTKMNEMTKMLGQQQPSAPYPPHPAWAMYAPPSQPHPPFQPQPTQSGTTEPTPQTSANQLPTATGLGPQVPGPQLERLIGPQPEHLAQMQWHRWYEMDRGEKEPIPRWNGQNPAKTLKPWLRDLRIWRQTTSVPLSKHGLKLAQSFESNSWLKSCADRIPEDELVTDKAWELIVREIINSLKPYLDVEVDVLIEETIFATDKESKETMSGYVTRKMVKKT